MVDSDGYEFYDTMRNQRQAFVNQLWVAEYITLSYKEILVRRETYKKYIEDCYNSPSGLLFRDLKEKHGDDLKWLRAELKATPAVVEEPPYPNPDEVVRWMEKTQKKEYFDSKKTDKKLGEVSLNETDPDEPKF